jgi:hypothetical protein
VYGGAGLPVNRTFLKVEIQEIAPGKQNDKLGSGRKDSSFTECVWEVRVSRRVRENVH